MGNLPLISVIVPVYGAEAYFDKCVASVVSQTYENLEIILLDDASPGISGKMCDQWALRDHRIKVIHKENSGTGATRNMGIDIASGSLIAFLDCDDYLHPDMYAHLYSIMDEQTDIAECGYMKVYDDNAVFPEETPVVRQFTPQEAMRQHIREVTIVSTNDVAVMSVLAIEIQNVLFWLISAVAALYLFGWM